MKFKSLCFYCAGLFWVTVNNAQASSTSPASLLDPTVGDGGVPEFYVWRQDLPANPGTMLRDEALPQAMMLERAAEGRRILYTSTDGMNDSRHIAVSGAVYFPKGDKPEGGWPIVAWAHGTTGVADVCAPSQMPRSNRDAAFLNRWLDEGFAVVATDYQGLGTPGPHPYLLYKPEAYSVLDSARAALHFYPRRLRNQVVAIGQSQGSGGALGAGYLAADYAPDINMLGVVAMGLVTKVESPHGAPQVSVPSLYSTESPANAAFEMLYLTGTGIVSDPTIDLNSFVSKQGRPLLRAAQTSCFRHMIVVSDRHKLTETNIFTKSIAGVDKAVSRYESFPTNRFGVPVFTATGLADTMAGIETQYNFISSLCHAGTQLEWHYYPGKTHSGTVNASLKDSVPYVKKLLAGEAPAGNCAALQPPGPTQKPAPGQ